jgi:molecular chaperone DnaK (HSP70)
MTVASSSGLSDKDIEKMVSDAERFAEEDKARKDVIEMANKADSFSADTEKGQFVSQLCFSILLKCNVLNADALFPL